MSEHTLESWRLALLADGYSTRTVSARLNLVRHVARTAGVAAADLQRGDVIGFLAARPYATWSRRTYLQHLTCWAEWIGRPDLTAGIRRPPAPYAHPDPMPEVELQRLLRHLREDYPREFAWVALGAYAGLRAAEVARFGSGDLGPEHLRLLGKGGRIDTLPIAPVVTAALRPWAHIDGRYWPVCPDTVSHLIHRHAAAIGIRCRFHQLRHRFGTAFYRETRDLLLTQRVMRHRNPQTTAGYAAVGDDAARLAVDQLPGATPEDDPPPKE